MPAGDQDRHAREVTELDRGRTAAFAGFAAIAGLLVLIVVAFANDYLDPVGWQGGEYAYAFVWTAIGSIVLGRVVKAAAPGPWRSIGSGMLLAGTIGVVTVIALIVAFYVALTQWNP